MDGERNLDELLRRMEPVLDPAEYVYATGGERAGLEPACLFREAEGATMILERGAAERAGIAFTYPCRKITLTVHSSLQAVGLLAAVATELAALGISVNVVSGYYHDHLFVEAGRAEEALEALVKIVRRNRR